MKRIITLFLVAVMLFGMAACGSSSPAADDVTTAPEPAFMAGFGKTDITPEEPVPMQGYADDRTRISSGLVTYLDAVCVAIQDTNGEIMLFMVGDTSWATPVVAEPTIAQIVEKLGVPADHIVISGTHTHNSVSPAITDNPAISKYNQKYIDQMVEAARLALEDRKPAQIFAEHSIPQYVGKGKAPAFRYAGRYLCAPAQRE